MLLYGNVICYKNLAGESNKLLLTQISTHVDSIIYKQLPVLEKNIDTVTIPQ